MRRENRARCKLLEGENKRKSYCKYTDQKDEALFIWFPVEVLGVVLIESDHKNLLGILFLGGVTVLLQLKWWMIVFSLSFSNAGEDGGFERVLQQLEKSSDPIDTVSFFEGLGDYRVSSQVELHTSRSLHKASQDRPRTIWVFESETEKEQPFVLAASRTETGELIFEAQSFDLIRGVSHFYEIELNSRSGPSFIQDPPRCFHCHSGARPLLPGLPREGHWPFAFPGQVESLVLMESKFSDWNSDIQLSKLLSSPKSDGFKEKFRSVFEMSDSQARKYFRKVFGKRHIFSFLLHVDEQNSLFRDILRAPVNRLDHVDLELSEKQRLLLVLRSIGAEEVIDLLSLHPRPRNYELSSTALERWKYHMGVKSCESLLLP